MAFEATKLPHEGAGVRARTVLALVLGFLVFVVALMAVLGWFYRMQARSTVEMGFHDFPAPRLQPNPTRDYHDFRKAQRGQLSGTRWVDQAKGLIHVPIERAMAYVVGRGASAYDPLETGAGQKPPPTPRDSAVRAKPSARVAPCGVHP